MARKLTVETLLRRVQHEINFIRKLDPKKSTKSSSSYILKKQGLWDISHRWRVNLSRNTI